MNRELVLDRYQPLSHIGEGGHGTVVLAYDTRMQRRVAIKQLRHPRDRTGRQLEYVGLAEARTAALLSHPNIVTVHEWDAEGDDAFIIMEHIDGASVAALLACGGRLLYFDEVAAVLQSVADAVAFAHDNGVLHLDIKPENVLVTRDGRVKVADLGIASLSSPTGYRRTAGGTLGFMPPEQLRGEPVDERTDVWAFAVLAYELLTGVNPMAASTYKDALLAAENTETPPPSVLTPELPSAIDEIVLTALAPTPSDRYPDLRSLARELIPMIGEAQAGPRSLADLVSECVPEQDAITTPRARARDRLARAIMATGARALCGVIAGWLAWAGLTPFLLEPAPMAAAMAIATLAGAIAPGVGIAIGGAISLLGIAHAGMPLLALAALTLAGPTWWAAGRHATDILHAFTGPLLSVAGLGMAAPLMAGLSLKPFQAGVLGGAGGALTLLASALSGAPPPFMMVDWRVFSSPWSALDPPTISASIEALVASPAPLAIVAAWALGAVIVSALHARGSLVVSLFGVACALAVIGAGYVGAALVGAAINGSVTWPAHVLPVHLAASSILVVFLIAMGSRSDERNDRAPMNRKSR